MGRGAPRCLPWGPPGCDGSQGRDGTVWVRSTGRRQSQGWLQPLPELRQPLGDAGVVTAPLPPPAWGLAGQDWKGRAMGGGGRL